MQAQLRATATSSDLLVTALQVLQHTTTSALLEVLRSLCVSYHSVGQSVPLFCNTARGVLRGAGVKLCHNDVTGAGASMAAHAGVSLA